MSRRVLSVFFVILSAITTSFGRAQAMPPTVGETLSGKRIALAEAIRGHVAVLVIGFSREAGEGCKGWLKAMQGDPSMAGVPVFEAAMLERAPGFVRRFIKSGIRKELTAAQQDRFVVLTEDDAHWRSYFQVTEERDPYVVLLDAGEKVLWRGHGAAESLETRLRAAKN